ncbi:hypothetical protein VVD49_14370 [Uliginosibacterium sp. H3]|uniref:Type IV pilus assembly protein PilN n=1 Tax=Uliginosibacterium silvisoli TaxID=3114758 RepID=A0ABU6K5Q5_9RHOO|nr:hypothetical protein [Uliginosibacterium sp. H3]
MKPMLIDFTPRQQWFEAGTDRRRRPVWAVACVLALVLLVACMTVAWKLQRERAAVKTQVTALQAELDVGQENDALADSLKAESAQSIQQANQFLNYPWAKMLGTLERNARPEVTMISLEMGVQRQSSKFVVEAADVGAVLSYVETLREEPVYASLMLVRQERGSSNDPAAGMRFTLEAPVVQPESPAARKSGER